ncbi:hypothetical protein [Crateriforma conspicua]|uniref:hypothetical protein n=1 Tax=Crateriforma conspicua TaxID=2527996 RepID=UPI001E44C49F|nr:hypothetical protein [Crateriforma conspicua]
MNNAPTAVDLQSLWVTPALNTPASEPTTPPRCTYHDRSAWRDDFQSRPGWIRTTCSVCGGFIGYRRDTGSTPELEHANHHQQQNGV